MSQDLTGTYKNNGTDFTPTTHHTTYPFISPSNFSLRGKTVLITGASKGVGLATAISFAQAGASCIGLAARSALSSTTHAVQIAAQQSGHPAPKILALTLDVTDQESVRAAKARLEDEFARLDILINNAGSLSPFVPLASTSPEAWWSDFEVNVKGVYLMTSIFLPLLCSAPDSLRTVINMSSIGAHLLVPGASAYQTTKLAVLRFSEFVSVDHGDEGVLCYSVHPGGVKTELAVGMPEAYHGLLVDDPELAGDTLVWLSGVRRDWLAGRYVSANWDMEELEGRKEEVVKGDLLKVRMAVNTPLER
ncbi:oxidoreductase-like protein [Lojkania enalia]|uniref:Oxidoreductase-like protein n=1 Tax=Lojkania enalia TaxID=147567 RepID=A0A9P4K9T7_9PLEO|nr:oxidoreductase-like protein [Didymosphaeria enalia]